MAVLHQATITPTKDQLVGPWLRTRSWWDGIAERGPVGTFRLDDPAGEVGIECFLFGSAEGSTLFVPVTYRGLELAGGETHLLGTMEHSVLGPRWVYDACGDPVFVSTLVSTIRDAGAQAELRLHREDGTVELREPSARVSGSGADLPPLDPAQFGAPVDELDRTTIGVGALTLSIVRRVGADLPPGPDLVGSFAGGEGVVLATIS
jgi:Maltokinase N-terminal cap domain